MRVRGEVLEPAAEVEGGNAGDLEGRLVRPREAGQRDLRASSVSPGFTVPPRTSVTRAVELRTSISIFWLAFSVPDVAVTVAVATPSPGLVRRRKSTTSSPTAANESVFFASAATSSGPEVVTDERHVLHLRLEREDGHRQRDLSSGPSTRGSVARSISGRRTKADFSAAPKAPSLPGHHHHPHRPHVLRDLDLVRGRGLRRPGGRGPGSGTMGGKRLALRPWAETAASSPPIASIRSIAAP